MRMVQFLFHFPFSHDFISFLLSVTSVTPQKVDSDSPAGIYLLCCVPLFSGCQYLPDRQIIEGMGNQNPRQEPYSGIHDSVLRSGSCPIISNPSLNVTGSGYYTGSKRNKFYFYQPDPLSSFLFFKDPLTYRKEIRRLYSVWRQSF